MIEMRMKLAQATPAVRQRDWKFSLVRVAILEAVTSFGARGFPRRDLPAAVAARMSSRQLGRLGSVGWLTTVVEQDMRLSGELRLRNGGGHEKLLSMI